MVEAIGAVGTFLRRNPFFSLAALSGAVLFLAGLGWLPEPAGLVLGLPAYGLHVLAVGLLGGKLGRSPAVPIAVALVLDLFWRYALDRWFTDGIHRGGDGR